MNSAEQSERKKLWTNVFYKAVIVIGIIATPLIIYYGYTTAPPPTGAVEGELRATKTSLGDFTFTPDECWCADRVTDASFRGIALIATKSGGDSDLVLRVEEMSPYNTVHVEKRGTGSEAGVGFELTKASCSRYQVSLSRNRQRMSNTRVDFIDGRVVLDCGLEGGGRVTADLSVESCSCSRTAGTRAIY